MSEHNHHDRENPCQVCDESADKMRALNADLKRAQERVAELEHDRKWSQDTHSQRCDAVAERDAALAKYDADLTKERRAYCDMKIRLEERLKKAEQALASWQEEARVQVNEYERLLRGLNRIANVRAEDMETALVVLKQWKARIKRLRAVIRAAPAPYRDGDAYDLACSKLQEGDI